ncbi:uncharacterized protein FRV6_10295 [Fusarium oxysporum]|uniref:Uncharacterized protein n=1 Tax=Fusarium oxysporum TaxID=5507 RepID=A0A2H3TBP0_FUSOX|nr:uncharacterized protein FRV6_10295 [Fusarium oxysporum]
MSWAAHRETTREEDMVYSLFGIFNLHLPVQYGEGKGDFLRLQDALIAKNDKSLFAWKMPLEGPGVAYQIIPDTMVDLGPDEWGLLAPSSRCGETTKPFDNASMHDRINERRRLSRNATSFLIPAADRHFDTYNRKGLGLPHALVCLTIGNHGNVDG